MFRLVVVIVLLHCSSFPASAQHDKWRRVFTGEDFIVDMNPATLSFETGRTMLIQFRTVFSRTQSTTGNLKYKTSLETMEFNSRKRYRYREITLLDSANKAVLSYSTTEWKSFRVGGVTSRLFDAAFSLPPFGLWTVVGYRYGEAKRDGGAEPGPQVSPKGTRVNVDFFAADVGLERCSSLSYESHELGDSEFYGKLGISIDALGVNAAAGDAIILKCDSGEWAPPQSLILPFQSGTLLMLWKGVFIQLKRDRF